jgi:hypothetical protein
MLAAAGVCAAIASSKVGAGAASLVLSPKAIPAQHCQDLFLYLKCHGLTLLHSR